MKKILVSTLLLVISLVSYAAIQSGEAEITFENNKFSTFSCWDSYLKGLYKDYMKLPAVEKRINHEMIAWIENE